MESTTIICGILLNTVTIIQVGFTYHICSNLRKKALGMQTLVDLVIIHTLVVQSMNTMSYVALCHWAVLSETPINEKAAMNGTFFVNTLTIIMCFFYLFTVIIKVGKFLSVN